MFHNFFEQFEGGGGGGHRHGHHQRSQARKKVDTQKYYDIIGVKKDATPKELKKAYRKKAMKCHPDRGGDQDKFKELNKVYDVLSDPEKREAYDKYGEGGEAQGGDPFDFFGGGGGGGKSKKKKGQDAIAKLGVTLEELYNGATKQLRFKKQCLCDECKGTGGKGVKQCRTCSGKGVRMIMRQLGPGMIQQIQSHCDDCSGQGEIIPKGARCKRCRGEKICHKMQELNVHINKGMKHGTKIKFREEADQHPNTIPGDLIVKLDMKNHPRFHREGAHLFYEKSISLSEALTGFEFTIQTLERRTLIVQSEPNVLYAPGTCRAIREEGMPQESDPSLRGNLYIRINVDFPDKISDKGVREIRGIFPVHNRDDIKRGDDLEEVELRTVILASERRKWKKEEREDKNAYDSDDEQHAGRGGQTAQCQTQ